VPSQCQGRSLCSFLEGESPDDWRTAVHWEFDFRMLARAFDIPLELANLVVHRTTTEKYVHFGCLPPLFFDLRDDPEQLRNLADDESRASDVLRAAQSLLSWRQATAEQVLTTKIATPTGMRNLHQPPDLAGDWRSFV